MDRETGSRHIGRAVELQVDGIGAVDANHFGAHVGQHHRAERAGAERGDLDHLEPAQRALQLRFAHVNFLVR